MNLEVTPHLERLHALGLSVTQAADWLELPTPKPLLTALRKKELPYWTDICLDAMEEAFEEDPEAFASHPLGAKLAGSTWTAKTARAALPVLIERAESGKGPLTYTELDAELARRHPDRPPSGRMTKYAFPLGSIGGTIDAMRREAHDATSEVHKCYAKLPPIECLVVNGRTGLPGEGIDDFLVSYLEALGEPNGQDALLTDRRRVVERIHLDIAAWSHWTLLKKIAKS
jgi:hypothetical protein